MMTAARKRHLDISLTSKVLAFNSARLRTIRYELQLHISICYIAHDSTGKGGPST
jgi:hypothetical protein